MAKVSPAQSNFNGGEVTPLVYGRPDLDKYQTGLKTCKNFIPLIQGPVERRPGTSFVAEVKNSSKSTRLIPFEFSVEQAYQIEFGDQYLRFVKDRGQIEVSGVSAWLTSTSYVIGELVVESGTNYYCIEAHTSGTFATDLAANKWYALTGSVYEVPTDWLEAELFQIRFAQSADILYIAHQNHKPKQINRTSDTGWVITDIDFQDGPYLNTNATDTTLALSGTTGSVTVTASATEGINGGDGFKSTDVGRLIRWQDAAGNWTWLEITAFSSTTSVTTTIRGQNASATTATTDWRLGVWSETTGYPAAVTFHQNRLCFAGATNYPQRIDMSRSGDFESFAPTDIDGTVLDDNGVATTLSADNVNVIRWLADDEKGLVVGTVGGEWVVRPDDNGGVLTPGNVQATRSSAYGSANIAPVRVGTALVFAQRALRKVRELAYVFEDDGFRAPDLTLVAEHITRTGIVDMAYSAEPQNIVWMPLNDGTLVGMTYDRDQQVVGFHRHTLGGFSDQYSNTAAKVESVSVIPNPEGDADELYMIVNRYINGGTKRYIEYLKPFWDVEQTQEESFFVDSGLELNNPVTVTGITSANPGVVTATSHGFSDGDIVRIIGVFGMTEVNGKVYKVANKTTNTFELNDRDGNNIDTSSFGTYETGGEVRKRVTTISGLSHLEGQTVSVLAEGAAHPDITVSSGSITLNREASRAQVGLGYVSDIQTLRQYSGAQDGTTQGKLVRIHRINLRFLYTLGGKVGINADNLDQLVLREGGDQMDTAVPLFTGDIEIEWDGEYSKESLILIRQDQPLPMILEAIMPQMHVQDRG